MVGAHAHSRPLVKAAVDLKAATSRWEVTS
jgi:hypothetical protein